MNLFLMVWRLVLSVLFPSRRDGLSLAARVDGRMEHLPQRAWSWLLGDRDDRPSWPGPPGPRGRPPARSTSATAPPPSNP